MEIDDKLGAWRQDPGIVSREFARDFLAARLGAFKGWPSRLALHVPGDIWAGRAAVPDDYSI